MNNDNHWLIDKLHSSINYIEPNKTYTCIELFAGGGLSLLGHHISGFEPLMVNEFDKHAMGVLKENFKQSEWKGENGADVPFECIQEDVRNIDFNQYKGKIDVIFGSPPCQAFSGAGKQKGFSDERGTLIFEFLRAVSEARPKIAVMENVFNIMTMENGKIFDTIKNVSEEIGYNILGAEVLNSVNYRVPQSRRRAFIVFGRKDLNIDFEFPKQYNKIYSLGDALYQGDLYSIDCEDTTNFKEYNERKKHVFDLVPEGGWWKDLPEDVAKTYCGKTYNPERKSSTGLARRLDRSKPSPTLLTSPSQKLTEFCHPIKTRPLTVDEYKRIMTLPDSFRLGCSLNQAYKIIGNGIPTLLSMEIALSVVKSLNNEARGTMFNPSNWIEKYYVGK